MKGHVFFWLAATAWLWAGILGLFVGASINPDTGFVLTFAGASGLLGYWLGGKIVKYILLRPEDDESS